MSRIDTIFKALKAENRSGMITFITAGDPDIETSQKILNDLPNAGADIIELGMPFSDPMADGKIIQQANIRSLANGQNMAKTFDMVQKFRKKNNTTPIILMGYYNPIFIYGVEAFIQQALNIGIDGLIIVDLPPEEEQELMQYTKNKSIDLVKLITPTSNKERITKITQNAGGFVYYISVAGTTGDKSANADNIPEKLHEIKSVTNLPIAVGFGIKTPKDVQKTANLGADAVVVGSAIVEKIGKIASDKTETVDSVLNFVKTLSSSLKGPNL